MKTVQQATIDTMRVLAAEAIDKAKSGHPGIALGAMPMAYALWADKMKHSPKNSKWQNRDRFILSSGHGSAMLYSLLHMFDYGLTIDVDIVAVCNRESLPAVCFEASADVFCECDVGAAFDCD